MSNKIVNDEPAFPVTIEKGLGCEGMSLGDYFAAKAMHALITGTSMWKMTVYISPEPHTQ